MIIKEAKLNLKGLDCTNNPIEIIIHHADAVKCSVEDINRWHKDNGWCGIGYHYLVRKDGTVWKGRPDNAIGAHCLNRNTGTLGVCFEGNFEKETMGDIQFNAGAELIKYLKDKYSISKVSRHKDYMSTDCPGKNFPFAAMLEGNAQTCKVESNSNTSNMSAHLRDWQSAYNLAYNKNIYVDGIRGQQVENAMRIALLKIGSNNSLVGWLQCRVGAGIDNIFGNETRNKVMEFQRAHSLVVDGIVGYNTWNKLFEIYR